MGDDVHFDQTKWNQLLARAHKLDAAYVKVGILVSKGAADKPEGSDMSLVEIAATHEFGSSDGHIPERSFIRHTFNNRVWKNLVTLQVGLAKQVVTKGMDPEKALGILGSWGAAEVKNTITESDIPPPLAQRTIDEKGSSKPLIDTGLMKNSITYEVVRENVAMMEKPE